MAESGVFQFAALGSRRFGLPVAANVTGNPTLILLLQYLAHRNSKFRHGALKPMSVERNTWLHNCPQRSNGTKDVLVEMPKPVSAVACKCIMQAGPEAANAWHHTLAVLEHRTLAFLSGREEVTADTRGIHSAVTRFIHCLGAKLHACSIHSYM